MKAWILEVNDHPSLNIYFDTQFMNSKGMSDDDICPIDFYVKSKVVTDAIKLAKKTSFYEVESFKSLESIWPSESDEVTQITNLL